MPFELTWGSRVAYGLDLIEVVDPVMADEIRAAAGLVASNPFAFGIGVRKPFQDGLEYRFLVRDHIRVRLNFTFVGGQNQVVIIGMILNRVRPALPPTV